MCFRGHLEEIDIAKVLLSHVVWESFEMSVFWRLRKCGEIKKERKNIYNGLLTLLAIATLELGIIIGLSWTININAYILNVQATDRVCDTYGQCDARPIRLGLGVYLPSHRASPPNSRYQFILLGENRHIVCEQLALSRYMKQSGRDSNLCVRLIGCKSDALTITLICHYSMRQVVNARIQYHRFLKCKRVVVLISNARGFLPCTAIYAAHPFLYPPLYDRPGFDLHVSCP